MPAYSSAKLVLKHRVSGLLLLFHRLKKADSVETRLWFAACQSQVEVIVYLQKSCKSIVVRQMRAVLSARLAPASMLVEEIHDTAG